MFMPQGVFSGDNKPAVKWLGETLTLASSTAHVGASFGPEAQDRYLLLGLSGVDFDGIVSGATIGGVTATLVVRQSDASDWGSTAFYIANVPNGTSGDVVVTTTAGGSYYGTLWHMRKLVSTTKDYGSYIEAGNPSLTATTVNGGWVFSAYHHEGNATATASGVTDVINFNTGGRRYAIGWGSATGSSKTVTYTASALGQLAVCSFH